MENRLFLLDAPGVPSGLTENILAGIDVTPETEYSGKITLTQLNAYSGELKAEALTNFQTIKLEKDGSETYTNVAKLLLELQQGGGADDAREEGDIKIASTEDDMSIRRELALLSAQVSEYHNVYSPVILDGYELVDAIETEIKRWAPSQEADGVRTKFVPRDGMSRDEDMIAVLNGVIVTPEDGSFIMSQHGPYSIGFEFAVAPSVGDVVEFFVNRVLGKASRAYQNAKSVNHSLETDAIAAFEEFQSVIQSEINEFNADKASEEDKRSALEAAHKDAKEDLEVANKNYADATSVADINETAEALVAAIKQAASISRDITATEGIIAILNAKISAASESLTSETAKRADAANVYQVKIAELEESIAMFAAIAAEHAAIETPAE